MTTETIEVDRDYLWALEVKECAGPGSEISRSEYRKANRIIENANLNRPRDR